MEAIAVTCNKSILIDHSVKDNEITGFIQRVPFKEGLAGLLNANGYDVSEHENIFLIKNNGSNSEAGVPGNYSFKNSVAVRDSLISVSVEELPLKTLLKHLADKCCLDMVFKGDITGMVSLKVTDISVNSILSVLFGGTDFAYKRKGKTILVGNRTLPAMRSRRIIKLNYLKVDKLETSLPDNLITNVKLIPVIENNAFLVVGLMPELEEFAQYIKSIDQPTPQILIEILVVDINDSRLTELSMQSGFAEGSGRDSLSAATKRILPGIDVLFGTPHFKKLIDDAGHLLGFRQIGILPKDFFLAVKALEQKGILTIHSRPQLATLNGCPADIAIGTTQYYKMTTKMPLRDPSQIYISETESFRTVEASISLQITPWVSDHEEITVEIHPQFNTPIGTFSPDIPPTLQSRSLNSTVRLKNGETIVLGGLIESSTDFKSEGIPFLSRLPIIGNALKGQSKTTSRKELIIYVTPYLESKRLLKND
jgi:type IV pilus assembly protein PilQ